MNFYVNLSLKRKLKKHYPKWKKNKAAGPDKIPIEFHQVCWEVIKEDIIQLFHDFHEGGWISVE